MKTKTKIWLAVGPLIMSIVVLALILGVSASSEFNPSKKELSKAASSMSAGVLKGCELKNAAISSNEYIAFFGSSELSRVNEFHPSVMARKYDRGYEPFLLGAPGTQSLTHYFLVDSMKEELKNKKVVFIVSPQWFVEGGVKDPAFSLHYSKLQVYNWVKNIDEVNEEEKYMASRLLNFSKVSSDSMLRSSLEKISRGGKLNTFEKDYYITIHNILEKEDALFRDIGIETKEARINKNKKRLPDEYDFESLDKLAYELGEKRTSNNKFEIANDFYTTRLSKSIKSLENSQKDFDYSKGVEFSDFQAVLNKISENNIDALFVITPVNKKWSDYTGLSEDMLNDFSDKMTEQLKAQGFNNIVDYTYKRDVDYFMEDTIHIGWRGWLELDKEIQKFLNNSETNKGKFKIDNSKYLSENWEER